MAKIWNDLHLDDLNLDDLQKFGKYRKNLDDQKIWMIFTPP